MNPTPAGDDRRSTSTDPATRRAPARRSSRRRCPIRSPDGPVTSAPFTPTQAGHLPLGRELQRRRQQPPVAGACNDANENVVVTGGTPTIATTASPNIALGAGTLTDTAIVSGRGNPLAGATITFTLFGPDDATCAGAPVFTPAPVPYPVAGGPVDVAGVHADAGGHVPLDRAPTAATPTTRPSPVRATTPTRRRSSARRTPTIATTASPNVTLGAGTLTDTAIVSGRVNPQPRRDDRRSRCTARTTRPAPARRCSRPAPVPYPVAGGPVDVAAVHADAAGHVPLDRAPTAATPTTRRSAGACNDANETTVVERRARRRSRRPHRRTSTLGAGTLTDTAIVSGRVNPQRRRDDRLQRCTGPTTRHARARRCSRPPPVPYPGRRWAGDVGGVHADAGRARTAGSRAYSGDANNAAVTGACNDANENDRRRHRARRRSPRPRRRTSRFGPER